MNKHLQILILILISSSLFGQPLSDCGNPVAHDICSQAPFPTLCELDGYTFNMDGFTTDNDPVENFLTLFCGPGTTTHNNLWIGFIANKEKVEFNFDLSGCQSQALNCNGIQAAIIRTDCKTNPTYSNTLSCVNCVQNDFNLTANSLIIGQPYYLMVDGCCGDICEFTLNVIEGLEDPTIDIQVDPQSICFEGQSTVLEAKVLPSNSNYIYEWTTLDGHIVDLTAANTNIIEVDKTGDYTVLVKDECCLTEMSYTTTVTLKDCQGDCAINIFSVKDYCNTDGTLDLLISFEIENGLDEGLDVIFTDGPTYNFDDYTPYFWDDTARIILNNIVPAIGQEVNFKIQDKNNPECYADYQLTTSNCEDFCYLNEMTLTENCNLGILKITLNLDYEGTSDTFSITGDGVDYGTMTTFAIPISIIPENQDQDTYEFTITDINNPECTITLAANGCSNIWPGDVNLDGIVNNLDLVYIGIANKYEGTPRTTQSTEWESHFTVNFDDSFMDGINYVNADCDGSGTINDEDILAIVQNYNKTHGEITPHTFIIGTSSDPELKLDLSELKNWTNGQAVSIPIILGDDNISVNNLYGISFDIVYPEGLFKNGLTLNIDETWLNNSENIVIQSTKNSALEIGISQKEGEGNSGSGIIGRLEGIIDDLTGMPIIEIGFDKVEGLTKDLELIPLRYSIEEIAVANIDLEVDRQIAIYPNPSSNIITFQAPKLIQSIEILDIVGQTIKLLKSKTDKVEFATSRLSEGVYFAKINIEGYVYVKKFEVMR